MVLGSAHQQGLAWHTFMIACVFTRVGQLRGAHMALATVCEVGHSKLILLQALNACRIPSLTKSAGQRGKVWTATRPAPLVGGASKCNVVSIEHGWCHIYLGCTAQLRDGVPSGATNAGLRCRWRRGWRRADGGAPSELAQLHLLPGCVHHNVHQALQSRLPSFICIVTGRSLAEA